MATFSTGIQSIVRIIPPNPADINFEAQFRQNTETFLGSLKVLDHSFSDMVNSFGGDPSNLKTEIGNSAATGYIATNDIINALKASDSHSQSYNDVDQKTQDKTWSTFDMNLNPFSFSHVDQGSLVFETLAERFTFIDEKAEEKKQQILEALTASSRTDKTANQTWSVHSGLRFSSLHERFEDSEELLKKAREQNVSKSSTGSAFSKIEDRFYDGENRLSVIEQELTDARASGSLDQRFDGLDSIISNALTQEVSNAINPTSFTALEFRFKEIEGRAKSVEDNIEDATTNQSFADLNTRFNTIDTLLENAYQKENGVNTSTFSSVELRFDAAETRLSTLEGGLTATQTNYALKNGDPLEDFSVKDLLVKGEIRFDTGSPFDIAYDSTVSKQYLSVPFDANITDLLQVPNRQYVDGRVSTLQTQINAFGAWNRVPNFTPGPDEGKVLQISGSSFSWQTPATVNTSTAYSWIPDVAFQTLQFDGEVTSNRNLDAGYQYYVAGNLRIQSGVTLTLEAGNTTIPGARLLIQGHLLLEAGASIVLEYDATAKPNRGNYHVNNWYSFTGDYRITAVDGENRDGIVHTSFLGLNAGNYHIPGSLVLEENTQLINDVEGCYLSFCKDETDQSVTTPGSYSNLGITNGDVSFFDLQNNLHKLNNFFLDINQVSSQYDTLKEISDALGNLGSTTTTDANGDTVTTYKF